MPKDSTSRQSWSFWAEKVQNSPSTLEPCINWSCCPKICRFFTHFSTFFKHIFFLPLQVIVNIILLCTKLSLGFVSRNNFYVLCQRLTKHSLLKNFNTYCRFETQLDSSVSLICIYDFLKILHQPDDNRYWICPDHSNLINVSERLCLNKQIYIFKILLSAKKFHCLTFHNLNNLVHHTHDFASLEALVAVLASCSWSPRWTRSNRKVIHSPH